MTFNDIFKNSFLEEVSVQSLDLSQTLMAVGITALLGIYIFFCYKYLTRKTFYSKNFNLSLIALAVITCGIILSIQSSVIISLGMVGALSIVRFRTAIKDPMDLVFLFWAISIGIICGAHLTAIAVIISFVITIIVLVFDRIPASKSPQILVINAMASEDMNISIEDVLKKYTKSFNEKSRSISNGQLDLVIELRVEKGIELTQELSGKSNIYSVSLLKHDGEVTF